MECRTVLVVSHLVESVVGFKIEDVEESTVGIYLSGVWSVYWDGGGVGELEATLDTVVSLESNMSVFMSE